MRNLIILVTLIFFPLCSQAVLLVDATAGFDIYRTRATTGKIQATQALNKSPEYPDWGAACSLPDPNVICWNSSNYIENTIPADEPKWGIVAFIPGDFTGVIQPTGSSEVDMELSNVDKVPLYLKVTFDKNVRVNYTNCEAYAAPITGSNSFGVTAFYINPYMVKGRSCNYEFSKKNEIVKVRVSFAGMGFDYSPQVYSKLPNGKHLFQANISLNLNGSHLRNSWIDYSLIDILTVRGYVNLESYLDFSITSSSAPKITISPTEKGVQYMFVQATLKTNFDKISTRISCEKVTAQGECALSSGNELLPLIVGLRADHSNTSSYTKKLENGSDLMLTNELGFRLNQSVDLNYLFGIDTDYIRKHPEVQGKTFTGNVSLIMESNI